MHLLENLCTFCEVQSISSQNTLLNINTLVNLYVDLRCLRRFADIYADLLDTKNGGDQ